MPPDPIYKKDTSLTRALSLLVNNVYDYIKYCKPLFCTSLDAIKVHEVINSLL
jgi:hypothetical protein